jgi:hypothetical protein
MFNAWKLLSPLDGAVTQKSNPPAVWASSETSEFAPL